MRTREELVDTLLESAVRALKDAQTYGPGVSQFCEGMACGYYNAAMDIAEGWSSWPQFSEWKIWMREAGAGVPA